MRKRVMVVGILALCAIAAAGTARGGLVTLGSSSWNHNQGIANGVADSGSHDVHVSAPLQDGTGTISAGARSTASANHLFVEAGAYADRLLFPWDSDSAWAKAEASYHEEFAITDVPALVFFARGEEFMGIGFFNVNAGVTLSGPGGSWYEAGELVLPVGVYSLDMYAEIDATVDPWRGGGGGADGEMFAYVMYERDATPEPSTLLVWTGLGVVGLFAARRWRR
jgi:hypothetical protein